MLRVDMVILFSILFTSYLTKVLWRARKGIQVTSSGGNVCACVCLQVRVRHSYVCDDMVGLFCILFASYLNKVLLQSRKGIQLTSSSFMMCVCVHVCMYVCVCV